MKRNLTTKEKEIFIYFIKNENPRLNINKIFNGIKEENITINKRTIKNTFDKYDQFNKTDMPKLLVKDFNTSGGTCYKIKENFESLDFDKLKEKIYGLEITFWKYKDSDEKHIGPMAEDFVAAFDVGAKRESDGKRDDQYLAASDVAGVALAGIKELIRENRELRGLILELEKRIEELERR